MRKNKLTCIFFGCINISFLLNKFDLLVEEIKRNVDALVISGAKVDDTFPEVQFRIPSFAPPFWKDGNHFDCDIMVTFMKNAPVKRLLTVRPPVAAFFADINLRNKKSRLCCP